MAKSTVKRKKFIRSYAGFTTGAAKYTIEPLTENAYEYARSRVPVDTGALKDSLTWDVRGLTGAVKAGGKGARHAVLIEYGTQHMKARSFIRYGVRKAKRELRSFWKDGLKAAKNEQSVRS